MLKNISNSP